jgi:cytochrome c oxidase assembly protein subunit 15
MSGALLPLARASFWLAFLVVLAGSVVRMTGSGMGCPDWPKCFGLLVPPTEEAQVTWTPGAHYDEGRMLVKNDTLWVAQTALVARDFDLERTRGQWQPYLKHDYATFNAAHTWIEFINRLLGALAGLPAVLLLLAAALSRDLRTTLLALLGVLALGFVAWLGKLVVDGNLIPHSITIHMLGALAILCIDSVIIQRLRGLSVRWHRSARWGLGVALLVTLAQILTGTEVRETVDVLLKQGLDRPDLAASLAESEVLYLIHRSGYWVVLLAHAFWMWRMGPFGHTHVLWARNVVALLLLAQLVTGILFAYGAFPAWAQPLHLLLGLGVFLSSWGLFWRTTSR